MRPVTGTERQEPVLAELAYEFMTSREDFIGTQVLPLKETKSDMGLYPSIPVEYLLDAPETQRAPRAAYARGEFEYEYKDFRTEENGFEEPVDAVEAAQVADYFDAKSVAMNRAAMIVLRRQEMRVAARVFNPTTFATRTAGVTTEWDNPASLPINDVAVAKQQVKAAIGVRANTLVISEKVRNVLNFNTQILNRIISYDAKSQRGTLPLDFLAAVLDIDQILVGGATYNSAPKGQAAVVVDIWDDEYAMVCRVESGDDLKMPQLGRTMLWTADSPTNLVGESYYEADKRCDVMRARQYTGEVITAIGAGWLLSNIHT